MKDELENKRTFPKWKPISKMTFTKVAVKWLLILGAINGTLPFILAAFDKEPVAEMGIAWITEIVAVILGYLCKSYFETKQERKQNLEDLQAGLIGDIDEAEVGPIITATLDAVDVDDEA